MGEFTDFVGTVFFSPPVKVVKNYIPIVYLSALILLAEAILGSWLDVKLIESSPSGFRYAPLCGICIISPAILMCERRRIARQVYKLTGWPRALMVAEYQHDPRFYRGLIWNSIAVDLVLSTLVIAFSTIPRDAAAKYTEACGQIEYCISLKVYLAINWIYTVTYIAKLVYIVGVIFVVIYLSATLEQKGREARMFSMQPTTAVRRTPIIEPRVAIKGPLALSRALVLDKICIQCHTSQCAPNSTFCGADCIQTSKHNSPKLMELPPVHYMFRQISDLFAAGWVSSNTRPLPKRIFLITSTEENDRTYKIYKEGVEIKRNLMVQGIEPGNPRRLWYGTIRECGIGDPGRGSLCSSITCPMCNHIRCVFDPSGRYGSHAKGIRVSSASSKSHLYSRSLIRSRWNALLLDSVVVGNPYHVPEEEFESSIPPSGFDSIIRSDSTAEQEFIVYHDDAVRPLYLVLYQDPASSST